MKFVILKINCDICDITIIKDGDKNRVFSSYEEIDAWIFDENLEQNDYAVLCIDNQTFDFQKILEDNQNKLI
jgi:hypothetical protein